MSDELMVEMGGGKVRLFFWRDTIIAHPIGKRTRYKLDAKKLAWCVMQSGQKTTWRLPNENSN